MLHERVLVQERPATALPFLVDDSQELDKREMLRVLWRAAKDNGFVAQLTDQGDRTLQDYDLTWQAKAALLSGDVAWIEARLGNLDARLRTWLDCRLQQETW